MQQRIIAFLLKYGLGWVFKKLKALFGYFMANRKDEKLNKDAKESLEKAQTDEERKNAADKIINNFNKHKPKP